MASCWCVVSHSVISDSLQPRGLQHVRLPCPWNSPGKNAGVLASSQFLLTRQGEESWLVKPGPVCHLHLPSSLFPFPSVLGFNDHVCASRPQMIIPSTDVSPQHCPLAFHRHLLLNMAKLEFPVCLKSPPALSHPVVPPFTWSSRILGIYICSGQSKIFMLTTVLLVLLSKYLSSLFAHPYPCHCCRIIGLCHHPGSLLLPHLPPLPSPALKDCAPTLFAFFIVLYLCYPKPSCLHICFLFCVPLSPL